MYRLYVLDDLSNYKTVSHQRGLIEGQSVIIEGVFILQEGYSRELHLDTCFPVLSVKARSSAIHNACGIQCDGQEGLFHHSTHS